MGTQFSSIKPRPYHSFPLIKSTSDTQHLNNKKAKTKRSPSLKELPSSTLLSKEKYFKITRKTLGLPLVFRNPYYTRSFYTLFSPDKAQLRVEHVLKGIEVLSGTQAEKAGMVFDWLDRNHDGVVSRKDLEQGLISTGAIMCDSLGHWLWLYTPREYMESPEDSYSLIANLQRLIPSESFKRFLDVVVSTSGSITREEWLSPRGLSIKEAIEWFISARCGDILSNLSSINSILAFSSVTPAPLSQKEVKTLEQLLQQQQNSSVFAQRILFLRSI